jgi:multidrug resistance efflux pump
MIFKSGASFNENNHERELIVNPTKQMCKPLIQFLLMFILAGSAGLVWSQQTSQSVTGQGEVELNLEFGVTGRVFAIYVEKGQKVTKGQVLAELDDAYFKALVDVARIRVERAGAENAEAERALERDMVLYDSGSVSGVELELTKISSLRHQEAYLQARAEFLKAQGLLGLSKIIAPGDGVVVEIRTGAGENIVAGSQRQASIVVIVGE